jgi:hypothetical protein
VRSRLPLVEEFLQPFSAGLPVRGLFGELLGLGDDPVLDLDRVDPGPVPGCPVLGLAMLGALGQRIKPALE